MPSHPLSATCLGCTTAMADRTTLASSGMAIANYRPVKKPRNTLLFTSRMGTPLHPLASQFTRPTHICGASPSWRTGEAVGSGKLTHGFRSRRQAPPATFRTPLSYSVCPCADVSGPPGTCCMYRNTYAVPRYRGIKDLPRVGGGSAHHYCCSLHRVLFPRDREICVCPSLSD